MGGAQDSVDDRRDPPKPKASEACYTTSEKGNAESAAAAAAAAEAAFESENIGAMAEAVANWAAIGTQEGEPSWSTWLRAKASSHAEDVMNSLRGTSPSGSRVLGVAWRTGHRRGKPHALLGSSGPVPDACLNGLRSVARRMLEITTTRPEAAPVRQLNTTTLQRCLLLYPGE